MGIRFESGMVKDSERRRFGSVLMVLCLRRGEPLTAQFSNGHNATEKLYLYLSWIQGHFTSSGSRLNSDSWTAGRND